MRCPLHPILLILTLALLDVVTTWSTMYFFCYLSMKVLCCPHMQVKVNHRASEIKKKIKLSSSYNFGDKPVQTV